MKLSWTNPWPIPHPLPRPTSWGQGAKLFAATCSPLGLVIRLQLGPGWLDRLSCGCACLGLWLLLGQPQFCIHQVQGWAAGTNRGTSVWER
jgi:hypothetical protein